MLVFGTLILFLKIPKFFGNVFFIMAATGEWRLFFIRFQWTPMSLSGFGKQWLTNINNSAAGAGVAKISLIF